MKTKVNLLLIPILLLGSFTLLFTACDDDDDEDETQEITSVVGQWYFYKEIETETYQGETEIWEYTYNPSLDVDYFGAQLYDFTETEVTTWFNESGVDFYTATHMYKLEDGKMISYPSDYPDEKDTMNYMFENNMFVIIENYNEGDYSGNYKMYFKQYEGTLPPASWTEPLAGDSFESDDTYEDATAITVGETTDKHTTTANDVDWYKFDAEAGETYLIQVSGYLDSYLEFYDTDGITYLTEDDDNDEDIEVQTTHWGNPVLLWNCPASGMYYFKITGYGSNDIGYYSVELTTSDLEITKTNNKKSKKKKKSGFLK